MSISIDEYDAVLAQAAHHNPEFLQEALDVQRGLTDGLLTIAQHTVDDPEKREILDELKEQAREIGLISSDEDECSCNCSCSSASTSSSPIELNTEDTDTEPDLALDPETPEKILDAAAQAAANGTDDAPDQNGEPSSGSLAEYREQQANAAKGGDTEDVDGTPSTLGECGRRPARTPPNASISRSPNCSTAVGTSNEYVPPANAPMPRTRSSERRCDDAHARSGDSALWCGSSDTCHVAAVRSCVAMGTCPPTRSCAPRGTRARGSVPCLFRRTDLRKQIN